MGGKEPSLRLPPPSGPASRRRGGRARVPRELAHLCGAASPAVSQPHHLSLIISPSVRTSLEASLLPLNLPGDGACPCLPPFLSVHSGEHVGTTVADGAGECGENPRWRPLKVELVSICWRLKPGAPRRAEVRNLLSRPGRPGRAL